MLNKKTIWCISLFLLCVSSSHARITQNISQVVQIRTDLRSFVGRPSWLLIIRDIDNNMNIPYLFDFEREKNFWIAFTPSRNYVITVSNLQFSPYRRAPCYTSKRINNFCHLETQGRIIRGQSFSVYITGRLTPNSNTYSCSVSRYDDPNFIVDP